MKVLILLPLILLLKFSLPAQNVGINADGSSPDSEAQLHLKTSELNYGLLNALTSNEEGIRYGAFNDMLGSGNGTFYGTYNKLVNAKTGVLTGTFNLINSDVSLERYGTFNRILGGGSNRKYGTYNSLGSSDGFQYASYNIIDTDGNDVEQFGSYQSINGTGNGSHFGIYNLLKGSGAGKHVGVSSELGGSSNSIISGVVNTINNIGNGIHYGVETTLENGSGNHYGIHNTLGGNSNADGDQYGTYTLISNAGSGLHYGHYSELAGSGDGLQVGVRNEISNTSNGDHWGTYNGLTGSGNGSHKGTCNFLLSSATGNQIGSHQQVTVSGDGIHAGTTNDLTGNGNGTHYGSKNALSGTGTGDQYATHNEITNSGSGTKFGTFNAINSGSGIHYAGWFDAAGNTNNYAAVFNRGDVVANEIGGNYDFRVESNNENGMLMIDGTNDRVGVGTDAPDATLHMMDDDAAGRIALIENINTGNNADALAIKLGPTANPTSTNAYIAFRDGDNTVIGSITGDGSGGTNFNTTSDRRLKMNIQDYKGALSMVNKIQPRIYERISNPGHEEIGFIAQELYEVLPQVVSGTPDQAIEDPMSVDYGKLTPVLIAAIQELSEQNELLKKQLESQGKLIEALLQNTGGINTAAVCQKK